MSRGLSAFKESSNFLYSARRLFAYGIYLVSLRRTFLFANFGAECTQKVLAFFILRPFCSFSAFNWISLRLRVNNAYMLTYGRSGDVFSVKTVLSCSLSVASVCRVEELFLEDEDRCFSSFLVGLSCSSS